ncbi:hypothetical protein BD289DRAFT_361452 [Coniella lustricola]|uniref:Uncharacterized protein n=1 Tax=Coniella lustricola TaxID=2025994 RepID=A0A2T3AIG5_9PEZI|nr:hypothetical protein BD289DRAFT_361452 [Coniella lustricola]
MQLNETVTIINRSGKVISNGKHIVNIFKEAKAAYRDKKAAIKADRAAAANELRPGIRKAHTFDDDFILQEQDDYYLEREYSHRQPTIVDDQRSQATSKRSHTTHRSKRSHAPSTSSRHTSASRSALTENNLRALSEASVTPPSKAPSTHRSPYPDSAPRDMVVSRPTLVHSATAPMLSGANGTGSDYVSSALSELTIRPPAPPAKKKEIDMNLAYGNVPPDLASRTDLGPATPAEEARKLMARIDALLDEAECVHHSAAATIDHLQRQPEAAAAVALLLAELSTLLKAMSPGFLSVVKGGFPAIFALLASPQFLIGVGVAVGVTVIFFGGWKIVKRVQAAKALVAEKQASRMAFEAAPSQYAYQHQHQPDERSSAFQAGDRYGPPGPGSYDDALVLEEELSTIETWRRGITPYGDDGDIADEEDESVDLELITPHAAQSVRGGDAMSVRTMRTHRTHKSHKSHKSHQSHPSHRSSSQRPDFGDDANVGGDDARSVAPTERSRRTTRSKVSTSSTAKTRPRSHVKAIEDGSRDAENTVDAMLRSSGKPTMLKSLFKKKKEREEQAVSVLG